jgi:hypothetical protein
MSLSSKTKVLFKAFTVNTAPNPTTLTVGVIPPAHRVKSVELYHGALGASVVANLGVVGTTNLFISAADVSAAGKKSLTDTIAGGVGNVEAILPRTAVLVLSGATTAATNQPLQVYITLVEDFDND